ncbi:DUF883 family protein [Rhizomicrobium electricum]|jgi:ElaB/YqjD/DUF883 family membrane-anchored ribosome-binding protein|uniref:DUF883 family protein n=1 Tax=Rhizomicrobium electricum TaxID=480070 RepID=A0ABP3P856_9PROT|nr:hypothetical protein [Rhizomicrobium electricum]NIJ47848.1 ElaB/YqjD/DUF883 family membrane-anchored ribosome-binding protein [Rhizomicrobium electricum]
MDSQGSHRSDYEAVVQDVKDLKNDSATLAGNIADDAKGRVSRMKDKASDTVNGTLGRIEGTVSDIWNAISKTSTQSYEAVERNVEQRPVTAVLAAFVAGAAIGWVLDRRR